MKALIIEDEPLVAKELNTKIQAITRDIDVMEVLPSLKTAKRWFMENAEPDLIFMDIQLSDGVSFELFDIYKLSCPVIFTTAYDEFALRAFKVNCIDYLVKPIDEEELKKAIEKCQGIIQNKISTTFDIQQLIKSLKDGNAASAYKEKFIVNVRNTWIPVNTSEIACFMRDYLNYLFTFSGEKYILDFATLDEVEKLLDPNKFYRANRQYIIHIDSIKSVQPHENFKLTATLKSPLKFEVDISREKAPAFKKWLDR
ncbi:DNA-binding response regulator [Adhaeribacter arboris]|uniref:DNA-binding response regulator n=1 Tax=Adhaeribacter arboris TaxID=2072846 RepID=A0A2T2YIM0_9BACT|nr:LytTR family DNA-binding domain-containing protein [Adhaeribacter arboris]PSR55352.1 DNA-binding response regulator [Adhaeribacter arboris]